MLRPLILLSAFALLSCSPPSAPAQGLPSATLRLAPKAVAGSVRAQIEKMWVQEVMDNDPDLRILRAQIAQLQAEYDKVRRETPWWVGSDPFESVAHKLTKVRDKLWLREKEMLPKVRQQGRQ